MIAHVTDVSKEYLSFHGLVIDSSDEAEVTELSEPEFTYYAASAAVSIYGFHV